MGDVGSNPILSASLTLRLSISCGRYAFPCTLGILFVSGTLDGEDRSATISQEGKALTGPVQMGAQNGLPVLQTGGRAISRVQNRYNLSVPNVLFSDLGLPTVPQNHWLRTFRNVRFSKVAGSNPAPAIK